MRGRRSEGIGMQKEERAEGEQGGRKGNREGGGSRREREARRSGRVMGSPTGRVKGHRGVTW